VLEDLARFCRAYKSTWSEDPREHALIEGRREVWLRIQAHLQLGEEDIWKLFSGQDAVPVRRLNVIEGKDDE
jgi:hypothetical protein